MLWAILFWGIMIVVVLVPLLQAAGIWLLIVECSKWLALYDGEKLRAKVREKLRGPNS